MTARTLTVQALVEVVGDAAALKLMQARGGSQMRLSARKGSLLVRLVGADAAKALNAIYGMERVLVPMGTARGRGGRQAAAAQLMADGVSAAKAALATDIHERTAMRIRAKTKAALPLFDRADPRRT